MANVRLLNLRVSLTEVHNATPLMMIMRFDAKVGPEQLLDTSQTFYCLFDSLDEAVYATCV